jgi:hypothetical protein
MPTDNSISFLNKCGEKIPLYNILTYAQHLQEIKKEQK